MTDVKGNQLEVNGVKLFYQMTGKGDPIVLLHGGVSSHKMWDKFVPLLASGHRVYALDMRGHGRSELDQRGISYPLLADDLAGFIEGLELERPHIIGYSSGANVALDFALRYPDLAASFVLGAAWLRLTPDFITAGKSFGYVQPGEVDFTVVGERFGSHIDRWADEHAWLYGREHWKRLYEFMCEMDLTPHGNHGETLKTIAAPVLVFAADADGLIPIEQFVEQYQMIPAAELLIVPGTNHISVLSRVSLLAEAILDFIRRH